MYRRITHSLRSNAVDYLALFVSLGGTSVAAVSLANHTIDPIKLDPRNIGGYVRAWASVNAAGRVVASGGRVTVRVQPSGELPGRYYFSWHTKLTSPCTVIGSVDTGSGSTPGYVTGGVAGVSRRNPTSIAVTYNAQGQPFPQPFEVELLCSTPR
ncbi:MAG: hypothetical protein ACYC91_13580 [Solirubrobacteraceae bacterium]